MEQRQRQVVGVLWLAVGALAAVASDVGEVSASGFVGLVAVGLALWLAVVYLFDPWGLLERYHP